MTALLTALAEPGLWLLAAAVFAARAALEAGARHFNGKVRP